MPVPRSADANFGLGIEPPALSKSPPSHRLSAEISCFRLFRVFVMGFAIQSRKHEKTRARNRKKANDRRSRGSLHRIIFGLCRPVKKRPIRSGAAHDKETLKKK
jgi:hypothetical protein